MEQLVITWETLLAIAGGVSVIFGFFKLIASAFSPYRAMKKELERHGRLLEKDKDRLDENDETKKVLLAGIVALLDHAITGNSIDKLKAARDNVQSHLVGRV